MSLTRANAQTALMQTGQFVGDQLKSLTHPAAENYKISASASTLLFMFGSLSKLEGCSYLATPMLFASALGAGLTVNQYGIANTNALMKQGLSSVIGLFSSSQQQQPVASHAKLDLSDDEFNDASEESMEHPLSDISRHKKMM